MKTYALIGASGYIAPRHMRAMADTGGKLAVAYDPNDSVGVMDSHFPDAEFFTEFERYDRHVDELRRRGTKIDYAAICSPNYLYNAHCRFALRSGTDAICEKSLVLNPRNIDELAEIERDTGRRISTILQLRCTRRSSRCVSAFARRVLLHQRWRSGHKGCPGLCADGG